MHIAWPAERDRRHGTALLSLTSTIRESIRGVARTTLAM